MRRRLIRLANRKALDHAVTHGTAIIDSATQCEFQPGDVGQSINVGSTTTTILPINQAQKSRSTRQWARRQALRPISVRWGIRLCANIGNCGFSNVYSTAIGLIPSSRQSPFSAMCLFTQRLPLEITLVASFFKPTPAQRGRAGRMCRSFLRPMDSHLCQYPQRLHRIRFGRESLTSISLTISISLRLIRGSPITASWVGSAICRFTLQVGPGCK